MRVLVCGDRRYQDRAAVYRELDALYGMGDEVVVIEGGAMGADRFASDWCERYEGEPESWVITHIRFAAEWDRYGRAAGPRRNQQMLDEGHPDLVLAFHDNLNTQSRGTKDMVSRARKAGIPVRVIEKPK